jgi:hypothetical protein
MAVKKPPACKHGAEISHIATFFLKSSLPRQTDGIGGDPEVHGK